MRKKILIVEDDDLLRNVLSEKLQRDYEMMVAMDGELGLKYIFQFKPDLVILDLLLPQVSGVQLLTEVRKSTDPEIAKTPILVFSNLASTDEITKIKDLGVADYIVKGTSNVQELTQRIEDELAEKK